MNLVFTGDTGVLTWIIPTLLMAVVWIRTPIFVSAKGKRILLWLKLAICLLLLVALLDPRWRNQAVQEQATTVFLVDVSQSIEREERISAWVRVGEACASLPGNIHPRLAGFDGQFSLLSEAQTGEVLSQDRGKIAGVLRNLERDENSDLGNALDEGLKLIPPGQRGEIHFFSDGRDTFGRVNDSLNRINAQGIPVHSIRLEPKPPPPHPEIIRVVKPEQVFAGEQVSFQVLIHASSGGETAIELVGSDQSRVSQTQNVKPGIFPVRLQVKAEKPGDITYSLSVTGTGPAGGRSVHHSMIHVKPLPRVLLFEPTDPGEGRFFRDLLDGEKISYQSVTPKSLPADFSTEIRRYPCMVLNNVHASTFTPEQMKDMEEAIKDGSGLLMLGGHHSFGLGNYTGTPIEEALPVKIPRRTVNEPMALILVLDRSGSMMGEAWWYLKEAAKEIIKLCKGQRMGIIVFNMTPNWVFPLQPINDPDYFCSLVDQVEPGGGTLFSFALGQAFLALKDLRSGRKSVILMSDGIPGDFGYVVTMLDNFRERQIPVSTIAAGTEVNPHCLRTIAFETGGKYYESLSFASLPGIFREEFKRLSGPPFVETEFKPQIVKEHTVVRGITPEEIPEVDGLLLTQLKKSADPVLAHPKGDPVLAFRRYGLGRTAALTVDLLPRWTAKWAKWDGLGKMMRQTIKELSEGSRERRMVFVTQKGTHVNLIMDIPAEKNRQVSPDSLAVTLPAGDQKKFPLRETAPNRFETTIPATIPGLYPSRVLSVGGTPLGEFQVPVNQSAEFLPGKANSVILAAIAEKTGGRQNPNLKEWRFRPLAGGGEIVIFTPLWPLFAIPALFLYLLDIYLRKANVFGIHDRTQLTESTGENQGEIFRQLATKFSNLAEEHSLKGEVEEAKRYYLRAKAFFLKAQATREANLMWERYKRFEGK